MAGGNFGGGNGSVENPYLVEDAQDLNAVRNHLGNSYKQVANIDLSGYANWIPIGTSANTFNGVYDGGRYTIANLNINSTGNGVGLFGYASGKLTGIRVISGSVYTSKFAVGAICGSATSTNPLTYCSNEGCSVTSAGTDSYYEAKCGGIVGVGICTNCSNSGTVTGQLDYVGGIVGVNLNITSKCYNSGSVYSPGGGACGIAGDNNGNDVIDCFNSGYIDGDGAYGIAPSGTINRCINTGNLRGYTSGKGIGGSVTSNCFALCERITRKAGSTYTYFNRVDDDNDMVNCYALDTMELYYE